MATIAIIGATGYAGRAITDEALARGHAVIGLSRHPADVPDRAHLVSRPGDVHDPRLVRDLAAEVEVIVVTVPAREIDGHSLTEAVPTLTAAVAELGTRLGFVGGAGSLFVSEGGPRLIDTPDFPEAAKTEAARHADVLTLLEQDTSGADWFYVSPAAEYGSWNPGTKKGVFRVGGDVLLTGADGHSSISGADFATAVVDEIEKPSHHRARFTVAY